MASAIKMLGFMVAFLVIVSLTAPVVTSRSEEDYISEVVGRLRALLAYLESINPAEAAKFKEAIEKAIGRLEEIRVRARTDPSGALGEAIRVQSEALRGARGFLARVNVTYPPGLLVVLDVKASMVRELIEIVEYLKSVNVTIEPWVEVKLRDTMANIEMLRQGLITGALSASQVAVKLVDVNRNISDVRVYLAKVAKPGWVKAHASSYTASELSKAVELARNAATGDTRALEELGYILEKLQKTLRRLPEIGVPSDTVRALEETLECRIVIEGNRTIVITITALLEKARKAEDRSKTAILLAEIARCLKQPLEKLPQPARAKTENIRKAEEVEENAREQAIKAIEINPLAVIGLIRAELEELKRMIREGRGAEEVKQQAIIVLKLAEIAEQLIEKLPKPAQKQLIEIIEIARKEAQQVLEKQE